MPPKWLPLHNTDSGPIQHTLRTTLSTVEGVLFGGLDTHTASPSDGGMGWSVNETLKLSLWASLCSFRMSFHCYSISNPRTSAAKERASNFHSSFYHLLPLFSHLCRWSRCYCCPPDHHLLLPVSHHNASLKTHNNCSSNSSTFALESYSIIVRLL